jgi:hypothetical protein
MPSVSLSHCTAHSAVLCFSTKEVPVADRSPKAISQADLFGLGSMSYTSGIFTILAIDYIFRDRTVASVYGATAIFVMFAGFVIGRRMLRKSPDK